MRCAAHRCCCSPLLLLLLLLRYCTRHRIDYYRATAPADLTHPLLLPRYHPFSTRHRRILSAFAVVAQDTPQKDAPEPAPVPPALDPFYAELQREARAALVAAGRPANGKASASRLCWYAAVLAGAVFGWRAYCRGSWVGCAVFALCGWLMGSFGHDGSHFAVSANPLVNAACSVGMFFLASPAMWYVERNAGVLVLYLLLLCLPYSYSYSYYYYYYYYHYY